MLLNCWRRLLRVPWTARRSNQAILNEISPGCSLEGLMLKLKLQYFGHLMWSADSMEKTLMLGKTAGRRRRGHRESDSWMASPAHWTWVLVNSGVGDGQGGLVCCGLRGRKVGHDWVTALNWTDAEKDWRQEEKWVIEDEMVRWHHRLNGHEFEQALGDGEG